MKTKKRVILSAWLVTSLLFVGCTKKEVKPETQETAAKHEMIQRYTYHDETYQIKLIYDDNHTIIEMSGDVESVQKFQQQNVPPSAYLVEQPDPNANTYAIHVFDDALAMNTYQRKKGVIIPEAEKQCSDHTSVGGTANYRFYEHADYIGELNYLTTNNQSYFQRDFYSAENDKITSFKLWGTTTGASVDIFEHGCFSGINRRFGVSTPGQVMSIPNLTLFSFTMCGGVSRDIYGQIIFTPYYSCGDWNDKISSLKGWSI